MPSKKGRHGSAAGFCRLPQLLLPLLAGWLLALLPPLVLRLPPPLHLLSITETAVASGDSGNNMAVGPGLFHDERMPESILGSSRRCGWEHH